MTDYISRQAAIEALKFIFGGDVITEEESMVICACFNAIRDIPAADVRENVKGEWTVEKIGEDSYSLTCPVCGAKGDDIRSDFTFNFCPNCGADMRGE